MRFNCICMEWTDRYSICKPLVRVCGDTTFHVVAHETVDFNRFHLARAPTQRSTETHRALLHRLQESIGCIKWKDRTRTEWQASKHVNFPTYRAGHEKCTRGIGTAPATQNHHQTCWCLSKHGPRSPHFALATEHCNLQHFSVRSPHVKSLVTCTMFSACHASAGKTSANALSRHFMYFCLALRPFESKWNTPPTVLEARGETAVTSQHAILMCLLKDIHWMRAAASITSWKITFGKFLWSVFSSHCTPFGFTSWFAWETVLPCVHWCPSYLFWKKKPSPAEFETRSDATAIPACQTSTCHCKCPAGTRTTLLHDFQNNPVGILVSMRFFSRIVSHLPLHSNPKGRMSWKRLLCQLGNIVCPSSRSQWKIFCQNSLNWDGLVGFHNAFSVSKLPCCNF